MSCSIGPNGFHDGEAPHDDEYDEDALSKLCDNPAYLVVGSDDDLVDNLPDWVEDLIGEHEHLASQIEKIGLEPSHFISVPSRSSNSELSDFLDELGFSVDSGYVERGPLSSLDGVVYVRLSKVPALQKRAARDLVKSKRAVVKAARKALKAPRVKAGDLDSEIDRLASIGQLDNPDYREKLAKLEELEESVRNLAERLDERTASLKHWRERAKEAERSQDKEHLRHLQWVDATQAQSGRYAAWTWAVAAEFGITIQGPLLKLPDGRAFAISSIFGQSLEVDDPVTYSGIKAREPGVSWVSVQNLVRSGMSSTKPLNWSEALGWFRRRLAWHQVWWVVLGRQHAKYPIRIHRLQQETRPDGSFKGFVEASVLPADWLGGSPERAARWEALLKEHWGPGVEVPVPLPESMRPPREPYSDA